MCFSTVSYCKKNHISIFLAATLSVARACVYMLAIGLQLVQTVEKSPNNNK